MIHEAHDFLMNTKDKKRRQIGLDILHLCQLFGRKVGFHANCTDGIVSAVLLKYLRLGDLFIPIDYWALNQYPIRKFLSNIHWFAIVDLEPFNYHQTEYYADHHKSSIRKAIQSKNIFLNVNIEGSSTAIILFNIFSSSFEIPRIIKNLVTISTITDTFSFPINAPINSISLEEIVTNPDHQIWYLEDACRSCQTIPENIELVDILSQNGLQGIYNPKFFKKVNLLRLKRKYYKKYISLLRSDDLVILINPPDTIANEVFVTDLLSRPTTKIVCTLYDTGFDVKISLRKSKIFEKQEMKYSKKVYLDQLARLLNGGGHQSSAGGRMESLKAAVKKISNWAKLNNFTVKIINLTNEIKPYT